MSQSLYFDGERYFLVPDEAPRPTRGHEAWTIAGEERRLSPDQVAEFEVSEGVADAFIAQEVEGVVARIVPLVTTMFGSMTVRPDPTEIKALMAGVEQTVTAVARGDQAAIDRFRDRAARVSAQIAAQGRPEMAELVRDLPDRLVELLGQPR